MINNLMYIELKTGYSDDGPAWIGYVKTSKSKKTIYFNDHAFQAQKQVMPKLTTAIKSTILIGLALLSSGFSFEFLCNQRVTGLRFTSVVAKRVPLALCNPLEKD